VAKKSKIAKNKRVAELVKKHAARRAELLAIIKNPESTQEECQQAYAKLARIPRNASPVRYRNRCGLTGRPRAYLRKFNLSRIALRELAHEGKIPGVRKSSW